MVLICVDLQSGENGSPELLEVDGSILVLVAE